ncbi:hypothetical protein B0H11DRAFT_2026152 [Mycena galericulata]|nr:hypothetical protein B0H11DRAFT_2026152 [Mycena galericulata]
MFKKIPSTAIIFLAILTQAALALPQTPPPGLGATCGTFLGQTFPPCEGELLCCQVEFEPAMSICLVSCLP